MKPKAKPLNILVLQYYTHPDEMGGAYRYTYEVSKRLARRGHSVNVLTCKPKENLLNFEMIDGIRFHRISAEESKNPFFLWKALKRRLTILHEKQPFDVIHVNNPLVGMLTDLVPALWKIPRVYHFHSLWWDEEKIDSMASKQTDDPDDPEIRRQWLPPWLKLIFIRFIEWHCFFWSRSVLFLSDYSRKRFKEFYPFKKGHIKVVGGGVDAKKFHPILKGESKAELRQKLGLPADGVLFLSVRRLENRMGLQNLIRAVGRMVASKTRKKFHVLIIGSGRLRSTLQFLIKKLDLADKVSLIGKASDARLPLYYRAADAFILPTVAIEGFGLATAEALASGLPVLGTPVGATPELLKPIDKRLLLKGSTPEAIATGMEDFLYEARSFLELVPKCRERALNEYAWESVAARIESEFLLCMEK